MSASPTQSGPTQKTFWQKWRWPLGVIGIVAAICILYVLASHFVNWMYHEDTAKADHVAVARVLNQAMRPVEDQVAILTAQVQAMGQRPSVPAAAPPGPTTVTPPVVVQPAHPTSPPHAITSGDHSIIVVVGDDSTVTLPALRQPPEPVVVADNGFEMPQPAATAAVSASPPAAATQPRQRPPSQVAANRPRAVPTPAQSGMGVNGGNRTGWASLAQLNINRRP